MSLRNTLDRLRRSVAVRISVGFALLFSLGFCAIFGLLYWLLGQQLEAREHEALRLRLQQYGDIYGARGLAGLQERVYEDSQSPHVRSLFIRIMGPQGVVWASIPPDWIDQDANRVSVPDDWGGLSNRSVVTVRIPRDEEEDLAVVSTVLRDGYLIQVARSTDSRTALLQPLRRTFIWVGGAVVLFGFAGGVVAARRATRPLQNVVETARRIIETGNLGARVPASDRNDDVAEVVRLFNTVLDKNEALLRAMREALDNVAHDLRTPLTSLRGTAELALMGTVEVEPRNALADCVERSDEVLRLLRAIMEISEAEAGVMRLENVPLDLSETTAKAVELYSEIAEAGGHTLSFDSGGPLKIVGDGIRLRQALANLVDNALKYTPVDGAVSVRTFERQGRACVEISDTGPGIPEAEQSRIWERLYRCDQSRSQAGLGLGLSLVRAIVHAHQGTVAVANRSPQGAVFTLEFPLTLELEASGETPVV